MTRGDAEHSDAILDRLLTLHPKVIDLSLDRLRRVLAALGRPERALPPVVHIAGTNGKGSVGAFVRAGLEASGDRVHAYTSPHLARFHERIRLAGALIDEGALADLLAECERANGAAPITFFEITTAAAMLGFARRAAEWCVLEVGLGGRLDATNVIDYPALTIITPVSLDHQDYLGDTVEKIAAEKAGILKPDTPCVVAPQDPAASAVIEARARAVGAPLLRHGVEWTVREENGGVVFEDAAGLADLPAPRLPGRHQVENAGVAAAALRALGKPDWALAEAMRTVSWPARLQRLKSGPLIEGAHPQIDIWLDGGHNPAAGAALAEHFAELEERASGPLYLICGMLNSKDPQAFLQPFEGLAKRVLAVPIPGEANAAPPQEIAQAAVRAGLAAHSVGSVEAGLRVIASEIEDDINDPQARALICGSLYLAGRILRENE